MTKRFNLGLTIVAVSVTLCGVSLFVKSNRSPNRSKSTSKELDSSKRSFGAGVRDVKEWGEIRNAVLRSVPSRSQELTFVSSLPKRKNISVRKSGVLSPEWSSRGPHNVGGRTRALAIDVDNHNVLMAGGVTGGLWRSADDGMTWTKVTRPDQIQNVTCIVQDIRAGKTNNWYHGTGERIGTPRPGLPGDGIYKSTDGGLTWSQLPATAANMPQDFSRGFNFCWNIAIDPSNLQQNELYAAGDGALYRSLDGGDSWDQIFDGSFFVEDRGFWDEVPTDVVVTSGGVVYATFAKPLSGGNTEVQGVWRSPDGVNWTRITPDAWPPVFFRTVIGVVPSEENVVYFLASTPRFDDYKLWKYTYLTGDGSGASGNWQDLSSNLTNNFIGQFSYDMLLEIKPDDPDVIYVGGIILARSTDGFSSIANTVFISEDGDGSPGNEGLHVDQHAMVFSPSNPDMIYSANDGGVYQTTHELAGQNRWNSLNNGYVTTQFYCVALDHATSGSEVMIGGTQDNGTWFSNSLSKTAPWTEILPGDGVACAVSDGGEFYYLWSSFRPGEGIWQARINENSEVIERISIGARQEALTIGVFVLDPNDTNIMYSSGIVQESGFGFRSILRNSKLDQTHSEDNWEILQNTEVAGDITAMAVSSTSPEHRLYYGVIDDAGKNPRLYRLDNAHNEDEVAAEFSSEKFPDDLGDFNEISSIAVDPRDANKLLVTFSGYNLKSVFYTEDGGVTWMDVGGNLEEHADGTGNGPSMLASAIVPLDEGRTFYLVGGSSGLASTTTLAGSETVWAIEGSDNIGFTPVTDIDFRASDGLAAVATHGNGIFSATVEPSVVSVDHRGNPPQDFMLAQNYPNPFNASTTIRFEVPKPSHVTIKVYNLKGSTVVTLVSDEYPTGKFETIWNANGFASGIYLYTIEAGAFKDTKKLTLLK